MKFALLFLVSALVVGTHQYFEGHPREMSWLSPHSPQPFTDKYQPFIIYFSKPDPRITYSPEELPAEMLHQDAHLFYAENTYNEQSIQNNHNAADSQARVKSSLEDVKPRFFFAGPQATLTNPFVKTATFTVSATITASSVVRCIPSGKFKDVAAMRSPCSRKRSVLESPETPESQFAIAPSEPLLMAASLTPVGQTQENPSRFVDPQTNGNIVSSKDEVENFESATMTNLRSKRFLFFNNRDAYVVSTTVTSLRVVTAVATVTAEPAADLGLLCLPYGYSVC